MEDSPARYPIRAAARMSGVSIDTLRAWERRYGAIQPTRDERGRMYSDADVQRLCLLRDAVARGQSIGRVARFDDASLRELAGSGKAEPQRIIWSADSTYTGRAHARRPPAAGIDLADLLEAIGRFDGAYVEAELARAAALLAPRELLGDLVVPLLEAIGIRWRAGQASIAHEHLASAIVRNLLGSLIRMHTRPRPFARLVFATPSGERHELGTLGAATIAASSGAGTIYLGPDMPAEDIAGLADAIEADAVVLGITATGEARDEIERSIEQIVRGVPRDVEIWLGGPAAPRIAPTLPRHVIAISNYDGLAEQLTRIGAQS